jgi:N-acyl-D-amino-acid deacylase
MTAMCEENVRAFVEHPAVMIGSDGEARRPLGVLAAGKLHPRSYGTFPRVLGRYVRGGGGSPGAMDAGGCLQLEEGVHKMTGLPAATLGLRDRGRVAVGWKADVVVFDAKSVSDVATFEDPYRYPRGIAYVLVNGKVVVEPGRTTGCRPGKVLRR